MSLIAHYLHKWKFRLAILIGLFLLWPLQSLVIQTLKADALEPYLIKLPLNLNTEIRSQWEINSDAVIEKVFVTGGFSDWHIDDPYYQLKPQKDEYVYELPVYPGDLEYKLVLFIKDKLVISKFYVKINFICRVPK